MPLINWEVSSILNLSENFVLISKAKRYPTVAEVHNPSDAPSKITDTN